MCKRIITIILALAAVCGCQKTEKTIYKVPLSEHAMELERQERAYNDSLEKYSTLLDTAQIQYYFDLHKAVLDTLGIVMRQEAEAFMAAKGREAANEENSSTTTELILLGVAIILLIATIIYVSITTFFWTRLGWFFEDIWHWLKRRRIIRRLTDHRYCSLINGPFVKDEDLTDEDIHEIMDLIHKGNPPKYEIKRKEESNKKLSNMNTSEYDKSIGMLDIDKEWAKFENEVINSKSAQHKMPIPPIIEIEDDRT